MNLGKQLRDEGTALALENAGEDWHNTATSIALKYFTNVGWDGALFEDARAYAIECGIGLPPSPNAWGAVALSLSTRRLITKTGILLPSKRASSHARSQPVWRLTSLHNQRDKQPTKYADIKDFYERCDKHPDHQTGMISSLMIERRLHNEIEELRQYIEQSKWVGLTDEEIKDFQVNKFVGPNIIRAIERRLKEKNT